MTRADFRPFDALHYTPAAGPPEGWLAPPYDVISPSQQAALYERSPHNVVRLILGHDHVDADGGDRYSRAAADLKRFRGDGLVAPMGRPVMTVHRQTFTGPLGQRITRQGVFGALRAVPFDAGVVLPHERTLSGPKKDRLDLVRRTQCWFSQIFLLYDDPDRRADAALDAAIEGTPPSAACHWDGVDHAWWHVALPATHQAVHRAIADSTLFVADGHHRYETALAYGAERAAAEPDAGPDAAFRFANVFCANVHDPGLVVFPFHRMVHDLPTDRLAGLRAALAADFDLEALPTDDATLDTEAALAGRPHAHCFLVAWGDGRIERATLRAGSDHPRLCTDDLAEPVRALTVSGLHRLVLEDALGITPAMQERKEHLYFSHEAAEVLRRVRGGDAQAGFLLPAAGVDDVIAISRAAARMPQKTTYFYPKIPSGVVLHDVAAGRVVPPVG